MTTTQSPAEMRVREVLAAYDRGGDFIPVKGKRPVQAGWSKKARATREECELWASRGNVGLRTGKPSGIVVIDLDEGAAIDGMDLPPTVTVVTGSNGRHLYYRAPETAVPNSAGKLGDHIDVRGDGGQVVFVGSVHPKTGEVYRWAEGLSPDEIEMAPLPKWIIERLGANSRPGGADGCTPYGLAALEKELDLLRATPEGRRNNELNRAAFSLGQLIAGGELDGLRVQTELLAATDLPADEAQKTVASGLRAGMQEPRSAPTNAAPSRPRRRTTVLVPGPHLDDKGKYHEVGEGAFACTVLENVPGGRLYRRGEPGIPGELLGEPGSRYFAPSEIDRIRAVASDHVRLVKWVTPKGSDDPVQKLCDVSRPLAGLIREEARASKHVRPLELIVPYPAVGCDPGWNDNRFYYDQAPELEGLQPETNREVIGNTLEDLLIDFPFQDEASRQNFIGLLLTLLLRPTIVGNIPLILVVSSLERTGKTKLLEILLGYLLLGYPTPALQLSGGEEEIGKRIMGLLLKSKPVSHLDNLPPKLDSASLSSLLTASTYQGRALGSNAMPELRNRTVFVASGNNVGMSSEMAKRTVPIVLQPKDDHPELRADFQHPDLPAYLQENRRPVLSCLLGMVANWEEAGRPDGSQRLGGFESFTKVVGGVMQVQGYREWLGNLRRWQRTADPHGEDLMAVVTLWWEQRGTDLVTAKELMILAQENNLFLGELLARTEKGQLNSFSKRVLGRHKDTPVGEWIIRQVRTSRARLWQLEEGSPC